MAKKVVERGEHALPMLLRNMFFFRRAIQCSKRFLFYVYACILAIVLNVEFAMPQGRPFEEDEIEGDDESVAHLEEEGITVIHHAEPGKGLNHPGWVAAFNFTYKRSFHHLDLKKIFPPRMAVYTAC